MVIDEFLKHAFFAGPKEIKLNERYENENLLNPIMWDFITGNGITMNSIEFANYIINDFSSIQEAVKASENFKKIL